MPQTDKRAEEALKAQRALEAKKAQLEKKADQKKKIERAKRIQATKKADIAKKAEEERKNRIQIRLDAKIMAETNKKKALEDKKNALALKAEQKIKQDKTMVEEPKKETEFIDFAITARKYKTLLTKKYKERKFWINPSPYDIQSYIPGTIIQIFVKEGRVVKEGDPLLVLESMKMQNRIEMPFTAKIKKINVKEGERIPKDFLMIELEPA